MSLVNDYMTKKWVDTNTCYPHEAWLVGLGRFQDQSYRDLMKQIANWANFYLDDMIEILVCLMIFFRQDQEGHKNLAHIENMWG